MRAKKERWSRGRDGPIRSRQSPSARAHRAKSLLGPLAAGAVEWGALSAVRGTDGIEHKVEKQGEILRKMPP